MEKIKYTETHEWAEILDQDNHSVIIGITERGQIVYGNIVYIELPEIGDEFEEGEILAQAEVSTGEIFPIRSPITGEIIDINHELEDEIDLINRFPESDGWICEIAFESSSEFDALMTASEYDTFDEDDGSFDDPDDKDLYESDGDF